MLGKENYEYEENREKIYVENHGSDYPYGPVADGMLCQAAER